MISYRMATEADVDELAQMRWDFRLEEAPGATVHDRTSFLDACAADILIENHGTGIMRSRLEGSV